MSSNNFDQFKGSEDYVASEALRNAVNVSIALGKPCWSEASQAPGKRGWLTALLMA